MTQVERIFYGSTKEEVIDNARKMINQWHEYVDLDYKDIIEQAETGKMEFDLVEIKGQLPPTGVSKKHLIEVYQNQYGG